MEAINQKVYHTLQVRCYMLVPPAVLYAVKDVEKLGLHGTPFKIDLGRQC
jgi:hypothetical protein